MQILITCPFWCASLLTKELKRLNLPLIESHPTAVLSEWTRKDIYRINLWSRIANKVYAVMWEDKITNFDQLFDFVLSLNWNSLFVQTTQFSLHASCKNSQIMSEKSLVSVSHKAILTSLNVLEDTKTDPDKSQEVFLFMSWNNLKVCINTSWTSLHQRWWRTQTWPAPLKENLAAAIILLSWWKFNKPLIDPFCGSGTIAIEAALLARNIAPWKHRNFVFQQFKNFDFNIWNEVLLDAKNSEYTNNYQIVARDIDEKVLGFAKINAQNAWVSDCLTFEHQDFQSGLMLFEWDFWLITNPPYWKRLNANEDLTPLYEKLADYLKECYGWVISSYQELWKLFNSKHFSHKLLYNWADEVDFYWKKPV